MTEGTSGKVSIPMSVLKPGRKRRHPLTRLARGLWGIAIGVALATASALILQ